MCAACRRPLSPGAQRGSGSTGPPRQYSPRSAFICSGPARGSASCPGSTRSNLSAAGHPRLGRLRAAVVCPPAAAAGGGLAAARVRLHSSSPAPPGHPRGCHPPRRAPFDIMPWVATRGRGRRGGGRCRPVPPRAVTSLPGPGAYCRSTVCTGICGPEAGGRLNPGDMTDDAFNSKAVQCSLQQHGVE